MSIGVVWFNESNRILLILLSGDMWVLMKLYAYGNTIIEGSSAYIIRIIIMLGLLQSNRCPYNDMHKQFQTTIIHFVKGTVSKTIVSLIIFILTVFLVTNLYGKWMRYSFICDNNNYNNNNNNTVL